MLRGKHRQRLAGNGAADAGERDRRADGLADDQLLDVRLGELVAIMPLIQREFGSTSGSTGSWIDRRPIDQAVENPQLVAVHDVLGVVEDDGLRACAAYRSLEGDQRVVEMVEAIRLGRRAVGFDLDRIDPVIDDAGNGRRGRRVVAIMADEDPIIVIVEPLQRRP